MAVVYPIVRVITANNMDVLALAFAILKENRRSLKDCVIRKKADEDEECPVCYEKVDEVAIIPSCGHRFHFECLEKWEKGTCPMCRGNILTEDNDDEVFLSKVMKTK